MISKLFRRAALTALLALPLLAAAQDNAQLRKTLAERVPALAQIDEIRKTPMPGVLEVRVGTDILYTDAEGNFLIQGNLMDTRSRKNLTEERVEKLTAVKFDELDLKNAITIVRGNGKRKLAVFEDPNCGYCKRFEQSLLKVDNVTVYLYLYPVLGPGSVDKSKAIWCAKDKPKAWHDWMLNGVSPAPAKCDSTAVDRNIALGKKHKITGTPTLVFTDGSRVPGAIDADQVELRLAQAAGQ